MPSYILKYFSYLNIYKGEYSRYHLVFSPYYYEELSKCSKDTLQDITVLSRHSLLIFRLTTQECNSIYIYEVFTKYKLFLCVTIYIYYFSIYVFTKTFYTK